MAQEQFTHVACSDMLFSNCSCDAESLDKKVAWFSIANGCPKSFATDVNSQLGKGNPQNFLHVRFEKL